MVDEDERQERLEGAEPEPEPELERAESEPAEADDAPMGPFSGRLITQGVEGGDVAVFQRAINAWRSGTLALDGVFGPKCEEACRSFQADVGARVDGVVGPATWRALRRRSR